MPLWKKSKRGNQVNDIISKDYMTTAEAARFLGITDGRMRQLISQPNAEVPPRIPSTPVGGRRFIKKSDVMAYAVARKRPGKAKSDEAKT